MGTGQGAPHGEIEQDGGNAGATKENWAPPTVKAAWVRPEIKSFQPISMAQGISFTPGDGISNLTP